MTNRFETNLNILCNEDIDLRETKISKTLAIRPSPGRKDAPNIMKNNYIKSNQNYQEYLEKPGSHRAHELLHTSYNEKPKYNFSEEDMI